jgi:hypothetical protein
VSAAPLLAATAVAALALLWVAIRRPPLACALLMLLVPLTTGLSRGSLIPLLKPSEAMLAVVVAGVILRRLQDPGGQELTWIDVVVALFAGVGVVVPTFVLLFNHTSADTDTWRVILAPLQLLAVYGLFARTRFSGGDLRLVLGASMLGGALVGIVAVAELLDVPGVRAALDPFYATEQVTSTSSYRPASLVGHYSAVGGLCLLNFILAAALAGARRPGFRAPALVAFMLANAAGIIASETLAPFLLLAPAALGLALIYRRISREMLALAAALGAGALALWPRVSSRLVEQGLLSGGQLMIAIPQTMQHRLDLWDEFILPALRDHIWLGTGTLMPGTVPEPLAQYVDSEYLWAGFRAGIPGIATLVLMLTLVAWAGLSESRSDDSWRRAIGPSAGFSAIALMLMGVTAQYLTFGGIVQEFGMLVGLLTALSLNRQAQSQAQVLPALPAFAKPVPVRHT